MATPVYPGPYNVFVPEATGQAIAYVRDPSEFKINSYMQVVVAPKPVVLYAFLDPDQPVRVVNDAEFAWPWGTPRPRTQANWANFKWEEVRVDRRNYGYNIDESTFDAAAGWNPKAFYNAIILSMAMTNVTQRFITLMENTASWGANTDTANNLSGGRGFWNQASYDPGSQSHLAIKTTINRAVTLITLATNGMVRKNSLRLVINPDAAYAISSTSEIHTYLAQSRFAMSQVRGDTPGRNMEYGLPDQLYGLELFVEDAAIANNRPDASGTVSTVGVEKTFIKDPRSAVICSRPGGLAGNYGAPSFSTLQRYVWKYDMAVEARTDAWNKIYEAAVVDQFKEVLPAPQTGYLIQDILPTDWTPA